MTTPLVTAPNRTVAGFFALLLSVAGVYAWQDNYVFEDLLGFTWASTVGGFAGLTFCMAGMRGQRGVRWAFGVGAFASAGVVAAALWPVQAGDANEYLPSILWLLCSALMVLTGVVALVGSLFGSGSAAAPVEDDWSSEG